MMLADAILDSNLMSFELSLRRRVRYSTVDGRRSLVAIPYTFLVVDTSTVVALISFRNLEQRVPSLQSP